MHPSLTFSSDGGTWRCPPAAMRWDEAPVARVEKQAGNGLAAIACPASLRGMHQPDKIGHAKQTFKRLLRAGSPATPLREVLAGLRQEIAS
jgi:hypothetical protein